MLVGTELKGELARIHPARECCRRAELVGLLYADAVAKPDPLRTAGAAGVDLVTLDPATARTAMHLAAAVGAALPDDRPAGTARPARSSGRRQQLRVRVDRSALHGWSWASAPACDHRAFLRGVLLGSGSISSSPNGLHVEFVFHRAARAREMRRRLAEGEVRSAIVMRRGRHVLYLKGREAIATLLRLTGANRGVLDLETGSVGREVRNRLNRLVNAEEANLGRTVAAAERQLRAIKQLERSGRFDQLSPSLRETGGLRRRSPAADLDELAAALGVSRSAANHRLRRIVALAEEGSDGPARAGARGMQTDAHAARRG